MRPRYGNPDRNQGDIVEAARKLGAFVMIITGAGRGAPDLALLFRGRAIAVEIKNPATRYKLQPHQAAWRDDWRAHGGEYAVINSVAEMIGLLRQTEAA